MSRETFLFQQVRQLIGFARILSSYGCVESDPDKPPCGQCSPCEAAAWLKKHDKITPAPKQALTPREAEVLAEFGSDDDWLRPMDLGGRNGSDHSRVLASLTRKGYVEIKHWGGHCRPSYRYRRIA